MFIDEKTRKRLYADTGKVLFTLDDKPQAVRKMMEIIRDTPEYLQLANNFPAYAQNDEKADWWRSKDADYLLADLLHVLELYTPDGFIFGPLTGRTFGFGYGNRALEKKKLYRIEISIHGEYTHTEKNQYRKNKQLYTEMAEICNMGGYTANLKNRAKGCRIVKDSTELHANDQWIAGYCEVGHLSHLVILLLKESEKFSLSNCRIFDAVFDFTEEEELAHYKKWHDSTIYYQIFDLFNRNRWKIEDNLMEVASYINIPTKSRPKGFDCNSPVYQYTLRAYQKLRDKGYLEEYTRTLGAEEFIAAKATQKGISKNIFYGTQL